MTFSDKNITQEITQSLQDYLQATAIQGAALAVLKDGQVFFSTAKGFASSEDNCPMATSTLFGAGSITKTFTALVFLLLEREGFLSLQDPVSKFLPDVEQDVRYILSQENGEKFPLLVKHLLSHTSGIPELGYTVSQLFRLCGVKEQGPYAPDDTSGLFSGLVKAAGIRYQQPGKIFLYSNGNYVLLARIAELVTGETFAEVVRKRILLPLGMKHSFIGFCKENHSTSCITGYIPSASGSSPVPLSIPEASYGPGGLVTNIDDLSRYLLFFLGNGKLNGKKSTTYSQSLWKKITARDGIAGSSYGLGWFIQENIFSEALIYHGGDILFSGGICALLPQHKAGIIMGQNAAGSPELLKFATNILSLVLNKDEHSEKPACSTVLTANEITGVYKSHDQVYTIEAFFEHSVLKLRLMIPGSSEMPELSFTAFKTTESRAEFCPATYPPSTKRNGCIFVRTGVQQQVWLQYESYLLQKISY
ncbi:MAG: beta-lactamase family protein [Anaerolineaceae bacterium]|nr:beta-lactamase family protein [Anaerolineaceae bacterium]